MLDLTSTFSLFDIKQHISDTPYPIKEKYQILERLYDIESRLENNNIPLNTVYLTFIENIIFYIKDLDKSMSDELKIKLNNIINHLNGHKLHI
jgi:hypothetical protein